MTDWIDRLNWIKHDGGPQPVTDDVFVAIVTQKHSCRDIVIVPAGDADWLKDEHAPVSEYAIVNQHLIDAAIVNRAVRGTGSNDLRWPHILKAARRLEEGLTAYKAGRAAP